MKGIVFLDMDGVLNDPGIWGRRPLESQAVSREMVARLSALCERLDLEVVISSSWRYLFDAEGMRRILGAHGFQTPARVVGLTPQPRDGDWPGELSHRGDEVHAYLHGRFGTPLVGAGGGWPPYVILDDMGLDAFAGKGRHLVQTRGDVGLTDADCRQAERCLARQR